MPTSLRISRLIRPSRILMPVFSTRRAFATSRPALIAVDSEFLSQITAAEKLITKQDDPIKDGPTVLAQGHVDQELTSDVIHDITFGERTITGREGPVQGGPTSIAQSILTRASGSTPTSTSSSNTTSSGTGSGSKPSGVLDSETISQITEKEKHVTGQDHAVKGGPTAQAQKHANEPITSEALHDITEGEKKVTGGERVKGGPASTAQSALGKSRS